MKKIVLLLFANLFLSCLCFSQKGNIELSLNNGINYSNLRLINYTYSSVWKPSYRYGLGIKYELFKKFHIGVEANMEEKGWLRTNSTLVETNWGTFKTLTDKSVNYYYPFLSFPLLLNYDIHYKNAIWLLETGFLMNKRRSGSTIKTPYADTFVISLIQPEEGEPKIDFGFTYGVGLKLKIYKNLNINFIGRYAFSFTSIGTWGIEQKYFHHKNYTGLVALSYSLKKANKK